MPEIDRATTVVIGSGSVTYDLDEAACDIDALIANLEEAKAEGATHVTVDSGNHRGAKWMKLRADYEWADNL